MKITSRPPPSPARKTPAYQDAKFFTDLKTSKADGFYGQLSNGGIDFKSALAFHGKDGFVNIVGITADGHVAYSAQNRKGHLATKAELRQLATALEATAKGKGTGDARMTHAIKVIATVLAHHAEQELKTGKPAPLSAAESKKLGSLGWDD